MGMEKKYIYSRGERGHGSCVPCTCCERHGHHHHPKLWTRTRLFGRPSKNLTAPTKVYDDGGGEREKPHVAEGSQTRTAERRNFIYRYSYSRNNNSNTPPWLVSSVTVYMGSRQGRRSDRISVHRIRWISSWTARKPIPDPHSFRRFAETGRSDFSLSVVSKKVTEVTCKPGTSDCAIVLR